MKRILTSLVLVASVYSFAQVSISGKADDTPQATLDVKAINGKANGILVPRVTRQEARDMPNPDKASEIEESTLIYVTEAGTGDRTGKAANIDEKGFYYFKDGAWVKLGGGASDTQTWRDFRTAKNTADTSNLPSDKSPHSISNGGIFEITENHQAIPETAFMAYTKLTGNVTVNLPDATKVGEGRIIAISKIVTGNIAVVDHAGLSGGVSNSQLVSSGRVWANSGKMFITDGKFWYAISQ